MGLDSADRGDGPARRLRDASHRGVVGGTGVEGQEDRSVVTCVQCDLDSPLSKVKGLRKKEK